MYRALLAALLLATPALENPALANDGFGGIAATGLTFAQTDAIAMETEDLFIGLDRIAVLEPPFVENRPPAEQYDTPGQDVTAALARHGIPLTLDIATLTQTLLALPPETRAALKSEGLADFHDGDAAQGFPPEAWPLWSIVIRYHWTQTFPAGQSLEVVHEYENRPPGGLFSWQHPPVEPWEKDYEARYCIDDGTSRAIAKRLGPEGYGTAYNLAYVLRTANSWAGPIGDFRLTLDKGAAENVISLCIDGIEKTGATTFEVRKKDFTPDRDLDILIVTPPPQ